MAQQYIDLHVHSTASDGTMSPAQLVRYAKEKGLSAMALTDHDTIDGVPEAMAEAAKQHFELVPGVEISVTYPKGEMHILGYYLDIASPSLMQALQELRRHRDERNPKMIACLNRLGLKITMEEVAAEARGTIVGRPHFAAAMVKKGYVLTLAEAFEKYLGSGKAAYVPKERLTPEEGIKLIREADGLAVLAHPKYMAAESFANFERTLQNLISYGLNGLEVYYSEHSSAETQAFLEIARKYNLLVTGGTDFHGHNKPDLQLGIGFGELHIPYELLEQMRTVKTF